jgi:polyisoprenoid-binding protein YceI
MPSDSLLPKPPVADSETLGFMRDWSKLLRIVLLAAPLCSAAVYTISPAPQAEFKLEVHKTGLMSGKVHIFTFERYGGSVNYQPDAPGKSTVAFEIEAASVVCRDTWIGDKDKQKVTAMALEMMESERHPRLKFVSQSVAPGGQGEFDVKGALTIKGITRPVTVRVTIQPEGDALRVRGNAIVLRKDYGINPRAAVPFGLIGNKDEMPVTFNLFATPAK